MSLLLLLYGIELVEGATPPPPVIPAAVERGGAGGGAVAGVKRRKRRQGLYDVIRATDYDKLIAIEDDDILVIVQ